MADTVYNSFKAKIMDGTVDLDTDTIHVALLTSAYTPDKDAHEYWDEVSSWEVSGSGYSAGGKALSGKSVTVDDTDDEGVFDASDVTWNSASITAYYAVFYQSTGTASTSVLIAVDDFGADKTSTNGNFNYNFASEGILNLN